MHGRSMELVGQARLQSPRTSWRRAWCAV